MTILSTPDQYEVRYDELADRMSGMIRRHRPDAKTGLDIGAQTGAFMATLEQRTGVAFQGVDPLTGKEGTRILPGWCHALGFPDAVFDVVTLISVFEHLDPDKRSSSLREIHRVLKPGGILVGQMPNMYFPYELHSRLPFQSYLPARLGIAYCKRLSPTPWRDTCDHPGVRWFRVGPRLLQKEAVRAGLKAVETSGRSYSKDALPSGVRFAHALTKLVPMGYDFCFAKPLDAGAAEHASRA